MSKESSSSSKEDSEESGQSLVQYLEAIFPAPTLVGLAANLLSDLTRTWLQGRGAPSRSPSSESLETRLAVIEKQMEQMRYMWPIMILSMMTTGMTTYTIANGMAL